MKNVISILLALSLLLSFSACSSDAAQEPVSEPTQPATQHHDPGDEVYQGELPLVPEGETATLTVGLPYRSNTEDYETNAYTLWLEEKTGVNLEFVYFSENESEMKTQLTMMIASNQTLPDVLLGFPLSQSTTFELGEDGVFLDLTELFERYNYHWTDSISEAPAGTVENLLALSRHPTNGALYTIPTTQYSKSCDRIGQLVTINQKWLDTLSLEIPTNIDELYNVLKAFATQDPNGNGVADELPAFYYSGWRADLAQYVINAWVFCNDDYLFNVTDGQLWLPYNTDEYREALKYLNMLYKEGLISPLSFSVTEHADVKTIYNPMEGPAIAGLVGGHPTVVSHTDSPVTADYVGVPPLAAESPLGGYANIGTSPYEQYFFVTSSCSDPVLAVKLIDFICGRESLLHQRYGVEGLHWRYAEPGELTASGEQADIYVIDSSPYSTQNNYVWHSGWGLGNTGWVKSAALPDNLWSSVLRSVNNSILDLYYTAEQPEEIVYKLSYNNEEISIVSGIQQLLKDYILEQRALFITGNMDPNNDADWETYLADLKLLGIDDFLAVAQSAWDRSHS